MVKSLYSSVTERGGRRNGRVYTIWLWVRDSSGNTTHVAARVTAQSGRGAAPAGDSGAAYTVHSNCPPSP